MYYVGIDIGSTASEIASRLLDEGIDVMSEGVRVAATGYGRVAVDYADFVITEITCHGRGGRELAGNECAIIDVGGQDTKVILVDQGMIQDFLMNDKCSAGTGKFLEIMANRLGVTIAELFDLAEQMKSEIRLEMKEIRRMLEEIKSNTAYFREFMEKYNIPMQEEVAKEQKEVTPTSEQKTDVRQKKEKEITKKL